LSRKTEIERTEERTFIYLNSRVHTRETSTLMFTTVAASASLLLLGILLGMENPIVTPILLSSQALPINWQLFNLYILESYRAFLSSNNLLTLLGILTIILGIAYREVTIFFIDRDDNRFLRERIKREERERNIASSVLRSILVRSFFIVILTVWIISKFPVFMEFSIMGAAIYLCIFTVAEQITRDC